MAGLFVMLAVMDEKLSKPLRRSWFAVWHWPRRVIVAVSISALFGLYLLSQAPLTRLDRQRIMPTPQGVQLPSFGLSMYGTHSWVFVPADWVYDHTPLQKPLLRWAKMWDVDQEMKIASALRKGGREAPEPFDD